MSQQIKPLTGLRGIAALMIVIHHFPIALAPTWGKALQTQTQLIDNSYLWVDFFFILSGFLMTHIYKSFLRNNIQWKDYKKFIFPRSTHLYPLHFILLFSYFIFEIFKLIHYQFILTIKPQYLSIFQHPFSGRKDIVSLFMSLLMLQGFDYTRSPLFDIKTFWNQPAWSISTQCLIYLVLPFVIFLLFQRNRKTNLVIYIFSLLAISLVIHFGKINHSGIPEIIRCFSEGVVGIITYQFFEDPKARRFFSHSSVSITSFLLAMIIMHTGLKIILIVPIFSLLILSVSGKRNSITDLLSLRFLLFLGTISYSIYMSHWLVQDVIKFSWQATFNQTFPQEMKFSSFSILLGVEVLIVLGLSSLLYFLIEKPSRIWLKTSYFARKFIYCPST